MLQHPLLVCTLYHRKPTVQYQIAAFADFGRASLPKFADPASLSEAVQLVNHCPTVTPLSKDPYFRVYLLRFAFRSFTELSTGRHGLCNSTTKALGAFQSQGHCHVQTDARDQPETQSAAHGNTVSSGKTSADSSKTFWELYQYSISQRAAFWDQCFHFLNLIYTGSYATVVDENARIDSIPLWFDGVHLNFAENLLYSRGPGKSASERSTLHKENAKIALTEVREGGTEIRDVTWGELRKEVSQLASAMKEHGVNKGDRVVVVASNSVDTLKVFLAITTLGGIFSSSSTDMGVQGILQRSLQVTPKVLLSLLSCQVMTDLWSVHLYG